jgi:hypothetical protein
MREARSYVSATSGASRAMRAARYDVAPPLRCAVRCTTAFLPTFPLASLGCNAMTEACEGAASGVVPSASTLCLVPIARRDDERLELGPRPAESPRLPVDEAKAIRDAAHAIAIYRRERDASVESQNLALEIARRAERRMGELLAKTPKAEGELRRGSRQEPRGPEAPTLAKQGISKKESATWQKVAAIPPDGARSALRSRCPPVPWASGVCSSRARPRRPAGPRGRGPRARKPRWFRAEACQSVRRPSGIGQGTTLPLSVHLARARSRAWCMVAAPKGRATLPLPWGGVWGGTPVTLRGGRIDLRRPCPEGVSQSDRLPRQGKVTRQGRAIIAPPRYPLVRYGGVLAPRSAWRALVVPRPPERSEKCHTQRPDAECAVKIMPRKGATSRDGNGPGSLEPAGLSVGQAPSTILPAASNKGDVHGAAPGVRSGATLIAAAPEPGEVTLLAPNILAVRHWDRLLGGILYATSPRVDWATLLRRSFQVDVLECPKCHGRLRIVAVLSERAPVRRILAHLGLPTETPPLARARDPTDDLVHDEESPRADRGG